MIFQEVGAAQVVNPTQAVQVLSIGHDSLANFRNKFWINFTQILI